MERFNRAERRAQVKRLKDKRKVYWGFPSIFLPHGEQDMDERRQGIVASTPCVCSCQGCSGTKYRRLRGNSLQGLKAVEQSFYLLNKTDM